MTKTVISQKDSYLKENITSKLHTTTRITVKTTTIYMLTQSIELGSDVLRAASSIEWTEKVGKQGIRAIYIQNSVWIRGFMKLNQSWIKKIVITKHYNLCLILWTVYYLFPSLCPQRKKGVVEIRRKLEKFLL